MRIKGRQPSKKCAAYIKRMISCGRWTGNKRIPRIGTIANTLGISYQTTRNVIRAFEKEGIIENFGSAGFFVISKEQIAIRSVSKNKFYLHMLRANLDAYDMVTNNAKQINNWIINFDSEMRMIKALNIVSNYLTTCSLDELLEVQNSPVELEQILRAKGSQFTLLKKQYTRQQELRPISRVVLNYKKELGINVS